MSCASDLLKPNSMYAFAKERNDLQTCLNEQELRVREAEAANQELISARSRTVGPALLTLILGSLLPVPLQSFSITSIRLVVEAAPTYLAISAGVVCSEAASQGASSFGTKEAWTPCDAVLEQTNSAGIARYVCAAFTNSLIDAMKKLNS